MLDVGVVGNELSGAFDARFGIPIFPRNSSRTRVASFSIVGCEIAEADSEGDVIDVFDTRGDEGAVDSGVTDSN